MLMIPIIINILTEIKEINIELYNGIRINSNILMVILLIILVIELLSKNMDIFGYIKKIEQKILIIGGIIGSIIIIITKDLMKIYLGIEIYSISSYILIYNRYNKEIKEQTIVYFIISTIISTIILIGIIKEYYNTGQENIEEIIKTNKYLIIIGLLFKLGIYPLNYWLVRIYPNLTNTILTYFMTINKILYIILLLKLINNDYLLEKILIILISLTILMASVRGVIEERIKSIITYSSILNTAYILILVIPIIKNNAEILKIIKIIEELWLFMILYIINIIHMMVILTKSRNDKLIRFGIIVSIFSIAGIPPLIGFYPKYYMILETINNKIGVSIELLIITLLSILLSVIYYLRIIMGKVIKEEEKKEGREGTIVPIGTILIILLPLIFPYIIKISYSLII